MSITSCYEHIFNLVSDRSHRGCLNSILPQLYLWMKMWQGTGINSRKDLSFFMSATEANGKPEDVKTSMLLSCIEEKARDICYAFVSVNEEDEMKLEYNLREI